MVKKRKHISVTECNKGRIKNSLKRQGKVFDLEIFKQINLVSQTKFSFCTIVMNGSSIQGVYRPSDIRKFPTAAQILKLNFFD